MQTHSDVYALPHNLILFTFFFRLFQNKLNLKKETKKNSCSISNSISALFIEWESIEIGKKEHEAHCCVQTTGFNYIDVSRSTYMSLYKHSHLYFDEIMNWMNIVDCGESQESHKNIEADTDVVKKKVWRSWRLWLVRNKCRTSNKFFNYHPTNDARIIDI